MVPESAAFLIWRAMIGGIMLLKYYGVSEAVPLNSNSTDEISQDLPVHVRKQWHFCYELAASSNAWYVYLLNPAYNF